METVVMVLAIIGVLAMLGTSATVLFAVYVARRENAALAAFDEEEEEEIYTVEDFMNSNSTAMVGAVGLHELFRAYCVAGFAREEAYGLVQTALHASMITQSGTSDYE